MCIRDRAQYAFADPHRVIAEDISHSESEPRHFCFGQVEEGIVTARFTDRGGVIRIFRARSGMSCAFGRRIRDAMLGAKRAVWLCHTSDSQQRSAPEAGKSNVQVISERALSAGYWRKGKAIYEHENQIHR